VTASVAAVRTLLLISLLALTVGCKDKPKRKAPPPNVGSAAEVGSGGKQPAPDLILPRADGTPPKRTEKPHTKDDYEKLSKLEFEGFTKEVRTVGEKVFEVRHKTKDFPRLWATVTIQHCLDCIPMELDKWKAKQDDLRVLLGALKDAKEGVEFEVGQTELFGQTIIYHHQVGSAPTQGEEGGGHAFTNAYVVYYNDGVNQIRVIGEYKDDPVSVEDMTKMAPKEDLRALALSFLDVYTHAW
jgi:hypothetical protein